MGQHYYFLQRSVTRRPPLPLFIGKPTPGDEISIQTKEVPINSNSSTYRTISLKSLDVMYINSP